MPSPKRADLDDYYAQLPENAVAHLTKLRELCRTGLPKAEEALQWNNPAFVQDGTRLLMLQSYKQHCSLRFPTRQFASQRAAVEAAGYEALRVAHQDSWQGCCVSPEGESTSWEDPGNARAPTPQAGTQSNSQVSMFITIIEA
jgi:uncharacterized protein YdhG (YjbR/CyaY superfamily)